MPIKFDLGLSKWVIAGLLVALVISNMIWYVRWDHQRDGWKDEKAAHQQTISNYKIAQKEAETASLKHVAEVVQKNEIENRKTDEAYNALRAKYDASIMRYQAALRKTGVIDLSSSSTTTSGSDSTSEDTHISITIGDAGICAENTARIKSLHDAWEATK